MTIITAKGIVHHVGKSKPPTTTSRPVQPKPAPPPQQPAPKPQAPKPQTSEAPAPPPPAKASGPDVSEWTDKGYVPTEQNGTTILTAPKVEYAPSVRTGGKWSAAKNKYYRRGIEAGYTEKDFQKYGGMISATSKYTPHQVIISSSGQITQRRFQAIVHTAGSREKEYRVVEIKPGQEVIKMSKYGRQEVKSTAAAAKHYASRDAAEETARRQRQSIQMQREVEGIKHVRKDASGNIHEWTERRDPRTAGPRQTYKTTYKGRTYTSSDPNFQPAQYRRDIARYKASQGITETTRTTGKSDTGTVTRVMEVRQRPMSAQRQPPELSYSREPSVYVTEKGGPGQPAQRRLDPIVRRKESAPSAGVYLGGALQRETIQTRQDGKVISEKTRPAMSVRPVPTRPSVTHIPSTSKRSKAAEYLSSFSAGAAERREANRSYKGPTGLARGITPGELGRNVMGIYGTATKAYGATIGKVEHIPGEKTGATEWLQGVTKFSQEKSDLTWEDFSTRRSDFSKYPSTSEIKHIQSTDSPKAFGDISEYNHPIHTTPRIKKVKKLTGLALAGSKYFGYRVLKGFSAMGARITRKPVTTAAEVWAIGKVFGAVSIGASKSARFVYPGMKKSTEIAIKKAVPHVLIHGGVAVHGMSQPTTKEKIGTIAEDYGAIAAIITGQKTLSAARKLPGKIPGLRDPSVMIADTGELIPVSERGSQVRTLTESPKLTTITARRKLFGNPPTNIPSSYKQAKKSGWTRAQWEALHKTGEGIPYDTTYGQDMEFATWQIGKARPTSKLFLKEDVNAAFSKISWGIGKVQVRTEQTHRIPEPLKQNIISDLFTSGRTSEANIKALYSSAKHQADITKKPVITLSPKRLRGFHQPEQEAVRILPKDFKHKWLKFGGFTSEGNLVVTDKPTTQSLKRNIKLYGKDKKIALNYFEQIAAEKHAYLQGSPQIPGEYGMHGKEHLLPMAQYHESYPMHDIVKVADVDSFSRYRHGEVAAKLARTGKLPDKSFYNLPKTEQKQVAEAFAGHEYVRFNILSLFKTPGKLRPRIPSSKEVYWYAKDKISPNPFLRELSTLDRMDFPRLGVTPDPLFLMPSAIGRPEKRSIISRVPQMLTSKSGSARLTSGFRPIRTPSYTQPFKTPSYAKPTYSKPYAKPPYTPPYKKPPYTPPYKKPPYTPPYKKPPYTPPYKKPPYTPPYKKPPYTPPYKKPPYTPPYKKPPYTPPYKKPPYTPPHIPPPPIMRSHPLPKVPAFFVEVRRRGEWQRQSKRRIPFSAALTMGGRITGRSPAASFRLRRAGKIRSARPQRRDFNRQQYYTKRSKEGHHIFIEKTRYRINTLGELMGITARGIASKKKSRGKPNGIFQQKKQTPKTKRQRR